MKRIAISLALGLAGCVSLTADGSKVKVYQAELATKDAAVPPLPTGCKLVGQSGPIDQQQQAFEISDPYRTERNNTAALGGNVLYVPFYRFKNLMKTDCPVGDTTPGVAEVDVAGLESDVLPVPRALRKALLRRLSAGRTRALLARWGSFVTFNAENPLRFG